MVIGRMMPGEGSHIFNGVKHCIFCDATRPGYDCTREPAIETLMYQALTAAQHRPCGHKPCDEEYPGMPSRWCHGCVIANLCKRVGWALLPEAREAPVVVSVSPVSDAEQLITLSKD